MAETISQEEFQEALTVCTKEPSAYAYYYNAPAGARMYICLSFYCRVFPERIDDVTYRECLREIEPELKEADLEYLLKNEADEGMREFFEGRLDEVRQAKPKLAPIRHEARDDTFMEEQIRRRAAAEAARAEALRANLKRRRRKMLKAAAGVAIVGALAAAGCMLYDVWQEQQREQEASEREQMEYQDRILRLESERAAEAARKAKELKELSEATARAEKAAKEAARVVESLEAERRAEREAAQAEADAAEKRLENARKNIQNKQGDRK